MSLATDMSKLQREQRTLTELQARNGRQVRERIRAAFEAGASWQQISADTGLSRTRIYQLRNS